MQPTTHTPSSDWTGPEEGPQTLPVLPGLSPKQVVKLLHACWGSHKGRKVGERQADALEDLDQAFLHLDRWPPEDEGGPCALIDKLLGLLQDPVDARVGHHTEGGFATNVCLEACGGSIVHADRALGPVNFCTLLAPEEVAGTGNNHTLTAVSI